MTPAMASVSVAFLAVLAFPLVAAAAGNVVAAVGGGTLILTGDGGDNDVLVDQNALSLGQLRVGGLGATTVNGGAPFVANGVTAGIVATLGAGNDNLIVASAGVQGDLAVDDPAGTDTVTLQASIVSGDVGLHFGAAGDDSFTIVNGTGIAGGLTVSGDAATDVAVQNGSILVGDLEATIASGTVQVFASTVRGKLVVKSGDAGEDVVQVQNGAIVLGDAVLSLGEGYSLG